jgi:hypothetical protein
MSDHPDNLVLEISLRLDRLAGDVERIKRRLDLVDAP